MPRMPEYQKRWREKLEGILLHEDVAEWVAAKWSKKLGWKVSPKEVERCWAKHGNKIVAEAAKRKLS